MSSSQDSNQSTTAASTVHSAATTGYGGTNATNYQAVRPTYPAAVATYVLQHTILSPAHPHHHANTTDALTILDVGCGTGKWTATLDTTLRTHQHTHNPNLTYHLTAADPVTAMTEAFTHSLPHIRVHTAPASNLPVASDSVDLLTAATAFHWFCDEASIKELYRVLKPGGCFAIIGYDLTVGNDWTESMQQLMDSYYTADMPYPRHNHWRRALDTAYQNTWFELVTHTIFREAAIVNMNRDGFVNRFSSASAIAELKGVERERVIERFNALIDSDERLHGKAEFVMKDDIEVTIVRKVRRS